MKETRENIEDAVGDMKEERLIIGGDFNARIGLEGSFSNEDRKDKETRKSRDKIENIEGTRLIEMVEDYRWEIMNGNFEGDEEDPAIKEDIRSFRIEDRIYSDHLPLKLEIYGETSAEKQEEEIWKERRLWTEEGKRHY
ncbi:uncharacterized protein LOC114881608 [Osmia bicornis bicornis]|uniref:uncharacterized protein LOC114881608 n=1 Tax=Osmia bicornis bicornis TaxID=1437191 RepID=UPI0010F6050C|nr:uncharacterized protein LOC114881608 [Osmia bicornis bicornis]